MATGAFLSPSAISNPVEGCAVSGAQFGPDDSRWTVSASRPPGGRHGDDLEWLPSPQRAELPESGDSGKPLLNNRTGAYTPE